MGSEGAPLTCTPSGEDEDRGGMENQLHSGVKVNEDPFKGVCIERFVRQTKSGNIAQ